VVAHRRHAGRGVLQQPAAGRRRGVGTQQGVCLAGAGQASPAAAGPLTPLAFMAPSQPCLPLHHHVPACRGRACRRCAPRAAAY
jgi:hypothetical protein